MKVLINTPDKCQVLLIQLSQLFCGPLVSTELSSFLRVLHTYVTLGEQGLLGEIILLHGKVSVSGVL